MAVVDVLARLKADTSQFTSAMNQAAKSTEAVNLAANKTSGVLTNKLRLGFLAAATAAGLFAVKLGRDSVQAAQQSGAAQNRLRRLLLNTNGATEEGIGILNRHSAALETLTGISQQNITTIQSQLATFDLHGGTIATLTPAILDYVVAEKGAGASADEFRSMTNGLAQALNGQFASLTKTGFVLDAQTKKMIKSGTESERAAAIVQVLNTTYRDFAVNALTPAQRAQREFAKSVGDTQKALGKALQPVIGEVSMALTSTLGPILANIQAKFADGTAIESFIGFIRGLVANIITFAKAVTTVFAPIFTGLLVPAIKIAIGAVVLFIKTLGAIGGFIQRNAALFQILVGVIVALGAAIAAYLIQVKLYNAYTAVMLAIQGAQGKATKLLTKAQLMLNAAMKLNPIGLVVAAVALLVTGFMLLWNRSEAFRKIMIEVGKAGLKVVGFLIRAFGVFAEGLANIATGPAKMLFKLLSFFSPQAKEVYEGLKNMTNGIGNFFDNAAKSVEGFSDNLDGLNKKKVKGPKIGTVEGELDLSKLGQSNKAAAKTKEELAAAKKVYEEALKSREGAMAKFKELLSAPFGTPSEITKALSHADATVDSILNMYKDLAEAVEERFKGINQRGKSEIIEFLDRQTKQLITLAGKREFAVEALKKSEEDLKDILQEQATFQKDLSKGIKDFARALINLSDSDTAAILKVTKTGSGLVISQVRKATTGIDSIVKQLTDRLTQVVSFGKNIEKLLAAGLSKDYIQQLLEAGPEAASETAQLLTTASADQIKQINSLYSQINTQANKFGTDMSNVFYGNAVAIAQAFVAGSKAELDSINAQMTAIKDEIESVLKPLAEFGGNIGTDLALNLIKALESKRAALVATAKSIAEDINNAFDLCNPMPKTTGTGSSDSPYKTEGPFNPQGGVGTQPYGPSSSSTTVPKVTTSKVTMPTIGGVPFSYTSDYPRGPNNPLTSAEKAYEAYKTNIPVMSAAKPAPAPIIPISRYLPMANQAQRAPSSNFTYGSGNPLYQTGQGVTVNVTTNKVTPTVTATTIANAVNKSVNTRSR
jgi:hypothetical protein